MSVTHLAEPLPRCTWTEEDPQVLQYHDEEWGVPVHNDNLLFELLVLCSFQAGLSWRTILHKREAFRKAFNRFNIKKVVDYDNRKVESLLVDAEIVRNHQKIEATIHNAKLIAAIQKEVGSLDKFIWQFTGGRTIKNAWKTHDQLPLTSPESDAMNEELHKRGFKFVGSTIGYAFMQSVGMVNDHITSCFRYKQV
jgi:DNA-3-methyladenine glycosylase I